MSIANLFLTDVRNSMCAKCVVRKKFGICIRRYIKTEGEAVRWRLFSIFIMDIRYTGGEAIK